MPSILDLEMLAVVAKSVVVLHRRCLSVRDHADVLAVGFQAGSYQVVMFGTGLAVPPHLHELLVLIIAVHKVVRTDVGCCVDANLRHGAVIVHLLLLLSDYWGSTQNRIGTSKWRRCVIRTIHVFCWTHLARSEQRLVWLIVTTLHIIGGEVHQIVGARERL